MNKYQFLWTNTNFQFFFNKSISYFFRKGKTDPTYPIDSVSGFSSPSATHEVNGKLVFWFITNLIRPCLALLIIKIFFLIVTWFLFYNFKTIINIFFINKIPIQLWYLTLNLSYCIRYLHYFNIPYVTG